MEQVITPHAEARNIVKLQNCIAKDKSKYTIQYSMSDLAFQEFSGFSQKIFGIQIEEMVLLQKQLDQPLSWFKKTGASILGIKTKHQFILFETTKFFMTIDFYEGNRVCIRVGDETSVLQTHSSKLRKKSQVVKTEQGLQWRRHFKQGELYVRDVLDCLKHKQLQKAHSKISFNGSHFSRKVWKDIEHIVDKKQ